MLSKDNWVELRDISAIVAAGGEEVGDEVVVGLC